MTTPDTRAGGSTCYSRNSARQPVAVLNRTGYPVGVNWKRLSVGERIRMRRTTLGLTQPDVAERCDGHPSQREVSFYETGVREPGIDALVKLARALECGSDYLLGLRDKP